MSILQIIFRFFTLIIFFVTCVLSPYRGFAQSIPAPKVILPSETFSTPLLKGIQLNPATPLDMNFIIDSSDQGTVSEKEAGKLARYFLTALTVPAEDLWVNLSPYEKERMIAEKFSSTEMGQELLIQDYFLKQLTASLTHPDTEQGKIFWDKFYQKIYSLGYTEVPEGIFNKVWIMPDKAVVQEFDNVAYVESARLKVLMEEDYVAMGQNGYTAKTQGSHEKPEPHKISSDLTREIILPMIEEEVNNGKTFAPLRQIYYSLVLSVWFKKKMNQHVISQAYADHNKIAGIETQAIVQDEVYKQYVQAFTKGIYDLIQEDYNPQTHDMVARHYFSGGFAIKDSDFVESGQPGSRNKAMLDFRHMLNTGAYMLMSISLYLLTADTAVAQDADSSRIVKKQPHVSILTKWAQDEQNATMGLRNIPFPIIPKLTLDGILDVSRFPIGDDPVLSKDMTFRFTRSGVWAKGLSLSTGFIRGGTTQFLGTVLGTLTLFERPETIATFGAELDAMPNEDWVDANFGVEIFSNNKAFSMYGNLNFYTPKGHEFYLNLGGMNSSYYLSLSSYFDLGRYNLAFRYQQLDINYVESFAPFISWRDVTEEFGYQRVFTNAKNEHFFNFTYGREIDLKGNLPTTLNLQGGANLNFNRLNRPHFFIKVTATFTTLQKMLGGAKADPAEMSKQTDPQMKGGVDFEKVADSVEIQSANVSSELEIGFPMPIIDPQSFYGFGINVSTFVPLKTLSQLDEKYKIYDKDIAYTLATPS